MKKVTIQDIAKEMGLSRNTVAKALSNGNVSLETKQAVVQKAWQMGYAKLDEGLLEEMKNQRRKSGGGTILVLFNRWQSLFWNTVLAGISDGARQEGYRMQLYFPNEDDVDGEEVLTQLGEDVEGIIFLCIFPIRFVKGIAKAGLPMTFFNSPVDAQEYIGLGDVYSLDGFYSMNRLTSYCVEKRNCRSFGFIGYAEGSRVVQARFLGFLGACSKYGIEPDQSMMFTHPSNQAYFNYGMVEEAINQMPSIPDAIVCENDDIAKFAATVLLRRSPALAERTVITGFDNTIEEDFFKQDILTVDVRIEELGKRLVKSVADRIKDPALDTAFVTITTYPKLETGGGQCEK